MPATRLALLVLPVLTLWLLTPVGHAAGAGRSPLSSIIKEDKPKAEVVYRVDYRGVVARPKYGHFYAPTQRVIKRKGAAPTVVQGPAKPRGGWGIVYAPTSWRQFRTVESPEAAARLCLSLQQMGLQTRVIRRTHRG